MSTGVADENEETGAEEELGDSGEVERFRIGEERHGWEEI